MSLKKNLKKIVKDIIGDPTGLSWKDLDHKKVYTLLAAVIAVIVLVIVLILSLTSGEKKQNAEDKKNPSEVSQDSEESVTEEPVDEDPLEVNAYDEVNDLVFKYFYARAAGDIAMYEEVVDVVTEEEIKTIEKKKEYIVSYHDLTCYTKKGLEKNSYVVFVTYNMELHNIQTYAPGSEALYVYENEEGDLKAFNGDVSEELLNHVTELSKGEDVSEILNAVQDKFLKAVEKNEELKQFIETLENAQQEEQEESEQPVEEPEETEEQEEAEEPEEETSEEGTQVNKLMQFNDTIRIRAERSTDSERLATGYKLELVTVLENYSDGWSKIDYNGIVGYCMTQFLEEAQ